LIDPRAAVTLMQGDVLDSLAHVPDECVDAVITDPPYGITLNGAEDWDRYSPRAFSLWCEGWARECLRVLKPGGWFFSFGSGKTYHRMMVGVEDAGFDVMNSIVWIYSDAPRRESGLIAKIAAIEDPELRAQLAGRAVAVTTRHDPIVVCRKPSSGSVLKDISQYGSGTLDVTSTRSPDGSRPSDVVFSHNEDCVPDGACAVPCPAAELGHAAHRFPGFYWCPKPSTDELVSVEVPEGAGTKKLFQMALRRWRCRVCGLMTRSYLGEARVSEIHKVCEHDDWEPLSRNAHAHTITHPSPKPLALMRWLVRLATLPNGLVLDCFAGSGATAEAAVLERRRCITIERDPAYLELVRVRLRRQHCFRADVSADV